MQKPAKAELWPFGIFLTLKFASSIVVVFWFPAQRAGCTRWRTAVNRWWVQCRGTKLLLFLRKICLRHLRHICQMQRELTSLKLYYCVLLVSFLGIIALSFKKQHYTSPRARQRSLCIYLGSRWCFILQSICIHFKNSYSASQNLQASLSCLSTKREMSKWRESKFLSRFQSHSVYSIFYAFLRL